MNNLYIYNSPIGYLHIFGSNSHIFSIHISNKPIYFNNFHQVETSLFKNTYKEISEYLSGNRKCFTIPLKVQATDFQKKVWKNLTTIPYGITKTYKDIALLIDNPKAYQSVGTAIGKNPIPIIIPCHRVINSNGNLGGYRFGADIKKKLLQIEGVQL